ncbi:unnamed protein product [Brassica oleracea]
MYSAVDRLLWVRDVLDGTPEMSTLLGSCFGGLFQIHVCRLYSGKVVHSMMTRQLVTKKKYEMWPVFGGNPLRFPWWSLGRSRDCCVASSKKAIALTTKFRDGKIPLVFSARSCDNRR